MANEKTYYYPCKLKVGDTIKTIDGKKRVIVALEGRHICLDDGSAYGYRHPDIVSIVSKTERKKKVEEPEQIVEEPVEEVEAQED